MKGFFVTGTGTGVGKTVVSVALIGALRSMGLDVCAMKPVESGCEGVAADGTVLKEASGVEEPMDLITPFMFRAPLAPLAAGRMEGRSVVPGDILSSARELSGRHELLVVEGVGGFLVPLAEGGYLVRDMAMDLGLPVVVVSTPYLGTVNHTLLTVEAIERTGLPLAGVVMSHNEEGPEGMAGQSSRELIEEFTGQPLLGELPYMKGAPINEITEAGNACFRMDMLRSCL